MIALESIMRALKQANTGDSCIIVRMRDLIRYVHIIVLYEEPFFRIRLDGKFDFEIELNAVTHNSFGD